MIYSQSRGLKSQVSLILLSNTVVEHINYAENFQTIALLKLALHGESNVSTFKLQHSHVATHSFLISSAPYGKLGTAVLLYCTSFVQR